MLTCEDVGFSTDAEFVGYARIHSETDRALFTGRQIAFALQLSGDLETAKKWEENPDRFLSVDLGPLLKDWEPTP